MLTSGPHSNEPIHPPSPMCPACSLIASPFRQASQHMWTCMQPLHGTQGDLITIILEYLNSSVLVKQAPHALSSSPTLLCRGILLQLRQTGSFEGFSTAVRLHSKSSAAKKCRPVAGTPVEFIQHCTGFITSSEHLGPYDLAPGKAKGEGMEDIWRGEPFWILFTKQDSPPPPG